jgi:hypothetical protein
MRIDQSEAETFIRDAMTRREKSRTEVSRTVARAYQSQSTGLPATKREESYPPYDPALAARFASLVPQSIDPVLLLAEESAEVVESAAPDLTLRTLGRTGEHFSIATGYRVGNDVLPSPRGTWEYDATEPDEVNKFATGELAAWFNCNPVVPGGTWKLPDLTDWRYALLESDKVDEDTWLRILLLARLPIVAIYRSGKRSVHCLYRVDATSPEDWCAKVRPIMHEMVTLGADKATFKPAQLTRLPGCMRGQTGRLQELLYLNGSPSGEPIYQKESRQ